MIHDLPQAHFGVTGGASHRNLDLLDRGLGDCRRAVLVASQNAMRREITGLFGQMVYRISRYTAAAVGAVGGPSADPRQAFPIPSSRGGLGFAEQLRERKP